MALPRFLLLFAVQFFLRIHGVDAGICQSNFTTIEDIRRSTAYRVDTTSGKPLLCDRGFIKDYTWYRFDSSAGSEMPTTKPDFWRCGTYAPIWMDGSHPQELEKPVSRKACVNLPYVPPIGCGISYTIQVIKCKEANVNKEFYLYQLKEPGYCSLAYCAGIYIGSFEVFSKIFLDSRNNKTNAVCVSSVSRMSYTAHARCRALLLIS